MVLTEYFCGCKQLYYCGTPWAKATAVYDSVFALRDDDSNIRFTFFFISNRFQVKRITSTVRRERERVRERERERDR